MQSYLKYKDYYDRKAKAAPPKEKDYCFILQPKANSQASKLPFRDYRWIGPFVIQKVLSNDNYFVRRVNTNKTQILHRIRLKIFVPNTPLQDNYSGEKLQPGEERVIPQDDLYTISWKVDFDYELFETRIIYGQTRPRAYRTTPRAEDESSSVKESKRSSERRNDNDVSETEIKLKPASSPSSCDAASTINESPSGNQKENDVTNELNDDENVSKRGADITVPGISENSEVNSSQRGGKYSPNPTPNCTDEYRYLSDC